MFENVFDEAGSYLTTTGQRVDSRDPGKALFEAHTVILSLDRDSLAKIPNLIEKDKVVTQMLKSVKTVEFTHTVSCGHDLSYEDQTTAEGILLTLGYKKSTSSEFFKKTHIFIAF